MHTERATSKWVPLKYNLLMKTEHIKKSEKLHRIPQKIMSLLNTIARLLARSPTDEEQWRALAAYEVIVSKIIDKEII